MAAHFATPSLASRRKVENSGQPAKRLALASLRIGTNGKQIEFHHARKCHAHAFAQLKKTEKNSGAQKKKLDTRKGETARSLTEKRRKSNLFSKKNE
jgi:hypothetical protein